MKSNAPKAVWQGAALLGGAALASKLIGTLQKIPLQNLAGDRVFGLYSAVYALAVMWMTLAAAGVPVAVSLLVAERHAAGDETGARRVRRYAMVLLSLTGLAAFGLLQAGAQALAGWMGSPEAAAAIRTSSLALLVAPMTAALRGYSQGRLEMLRPAASQLLEQTARVAFMLIALLWALREAYSPAATAAAVHGGLAAGAAAGLVAMLLPGWGGRRDAGKTEARPEPASEREPPSGRVDAEESGKALGALASRREPQGGRADAGASGGRPAQEWEPFAPAPAAARAERGWPLVRRIAAVALPVAAGSVVAPLFGLIDAFTLPRLLQGAGGTAAAAMTAFGEYNRGIALLQLVAMAAGGAAAALVPAMTAARAKGDAAGLGEQTAFAMRLAWWFGGAAAVGLALLAKPVNVALFENGHGTGAMALLAFASLGAALQAVSAALLQGLGDLRSPALYLAAAALVKAALNAAL
ncbi:oligosaccharide flippase family protein, partial [Cohnella nanjingensis]